MDARLPQRNERGIALVIAMLILLVMTLLGLVLMAGASLNRSLAGNDQRMRQALNVAEAGVGEAEARIRNQETLMTSAVPSAVCQVFNVLPGGVPALGADSVGLATGQPAGSYLSYTTSTRSPDALTVSWKKNAAGTAVMRYDNTRNPALNTVSGMPVYVITSTGTMGTARRTVVTEVIQKPFNTSIKGALAADVGVKFTGNAVVCGYNHSADTPVDDGKNGRGNAPDCMDNETGAGNLTGIWTSNTVSGGGASSAFGSPSPTLETQTGFYAGPWEACNMSQADFFSWLGTPTTNPATLNGITYIDNNSTSQDKSASAAFHGADGEGLLYVDGDLHVNAGFTFRGLIYVEGDFDVNGHAWILGGVVVKGRGQIKANGGSTILYSSDAISQALAKYGGQFVTLSWREQ